MEQILIDPTAEEIAVSSQISDRLSKLHNKSIALLDNIKHNAEYLLTEIGERLTREFGCKVHVVKKKTYTKYCDPLILASLCSYDAVITAIGD